MLLLRRVAPQGFAFGDEACLPERLLQVFFPLLFSSRLFFFFPLPVFTGLLRLPSFPLPSRLFFLLLPDLLDLGPPRENNTLPMSSSQKQTPLQPNFLIKTV